ncbi:MAG: amino acid adenylation domain-containing protein [Phycisphaerales bacterium]
MSQPRLQSQTSELPLLVELFARVARTHADRLAIDVPPGRDRPRRTMTYGELDARSAGLAQRLRRELDRRGADDEPIVAIRLPRDTPALYVAQLATLRAGAAFTCIDPAFPPEHARAVIDDASAAVVIADAAGRAWLADAGIAAERVVDVASADAPEPNAPPASIAPSRLAYVIYTSGTTGAPKGVMVEHGSIANLVRSDIELFGLSPDDRVAQCSSPAYDSSLEEMWLAFGVGATLVPLDDATVRLGPDLVAWLNRERVSVLCPPPTLLRTMACDDPKRALPHLKLLYVGGEALPQDVADRWGDGRWLENGYGPTECTVTVVRGRMTPGKPVTIGQPVDGNRAWVLDDALDEVPDGTEGELCIGGASVARGYRHRPDVTAQKFVEHERLGRIYRTGDLVRRNADGDLEYLGRIDGQVKLRGYRVELAAVEALLARCPGVREAACRVQGTDGAQALVAHLVPSDATSPPDVASLRAELARSLPAYMVPSRIAAIAELPRTVGGKIDRRRLPEIAIARDLARDVRSPRDARERAIVDAFARATGFRDPVSIDDDFFTALGGDSVSAVAALCSLRADASTARCTVRDLYEQRTAERLARLLASSGAEARAARVRAGRAAEPTAATFVQGLWLALAIVASGAASYLVAYRWLPILARDVGLDGAILAAPFVTLVGLLLYAPFAVAWTALLQRLLLGRVRPCSMPVWSGPYVRHWIVQHAARAIPWGVLEGTIFLNAALRVLGARIGKRVHIHRGVDLRRGAWDLLSLGDDVTLAQDAALGLVELRDGQLVLGPISIGDRCTVGVRAGVGRNATMENDASLTALSYLDDGATAPAGERWDGVPARCVGRTPPAPSPSRGTPLSPFIHGCATIAIRFLGRLVVAAPWIAIAWWWTRRGDDSVEPLLAWLAAPELSPSTIAALVVVSLVATPLSLVAQALSLRLAGRIRPGVLSRWSLEYVAVWTKSRVLDAAGRWLSGTLFWPVWLRLAGMRVGRGCEVSTIIDVVPESIAIGDTSFFADGIYFASPDVDRGAVTIAPTSLGRETFLGNHAVVPAGHSYPDQYFVGVSTVADASTARRGTAWFGHPPIELPRREVVAGDRQLTHDPGWLRYSSRLFWESLRFTLPVLPIVVALAWWKVIAAAELRWSAATVAFVVAPLATLGGVAALAAAIVALKWSLLLRVRPGQHPLWSCWCSRWDFLYVAWGFYARNFLQALEGTIFLTWFLRLIGVRIGKRVVLGGGFVHVVDPDMLSIGDDATVDCHFQAHSFEDRILKIDHVHIRAGATLGHNAVLFYGVDVGADAEVAPHSVVMKRERVGEGERFTGAPAVSHASSASTRRDGGAEGTRSDAKG